MIDREGLKERERKLYKAQHKARARQELLAFTTYTKYDYQVNWHHRQLCRILDRFIRKEIRFLLLFEPPRTGKSELVSRRLPALLHGLYPDDQILAGSYSASLASEMTSDVQKIIDSDEYSELFPSTLIPPAGKKIPPYTRSARGHDIIDRRGKYRGAGVGGAFTGKGANWLLIDDPIKNEQEADSEVWRNRLWRWYQTAARSRLEKNGSVLITLTRWHMDDLAGRILKEMKTTPDYDQFEVFKHEMIREDLDDDSDPRDEGEPLWPEKYDLAACKALKAGAGSRGWSALYQQSPTSSEGSIVKRGWLKYYKELPHELDIDRWLISVDATFKDAKNSDYVAMQVWCRSKSRHFLVDRIKERMDFTQTCEKIRQLRAKHKKARTVLIEDAANGAAIENTLSKTLTGIILVKPEGSKDARLSAVSPMFEAGNVFLPDPDVAPWVGDYVEELVTFPFAPNDDEVDATTQALRRFQDSGDNVLRNMVTL